MAQNKKINILPGLIMLFLLLLTGCGKDTKIYYVSAEGSDDNAGTRTQALKTIERAVELLGQWISPNCLSMVKDR